MAGFRLRSGTDGLLERGRRATGCREGSDATGRQSRPARSDAGVILGTMRSSSVWPNSMTLVRSAAALILTAALVGCGGGARATPSTGSTTPTSSAAAIATARASASSGPTLTPVPSRIVHATQGPVSTGVPISLADLSGQIVFDNFEDVFAFDVDGSNVVTIAGQPGAEFDGAWSPDGEWVVYRNSTRGMNEDDEIFVARADCSERRNITNNPANDWGPDWSPDGSTIVFNSDRDGGRLRGYLVNPDGSNLRRIDVNSWFEYPSFSPDGRRIVFEGALNNNYEVFVLIRETGAVTQLTEAPGNDSWAVWSPDGSTIAFTSQRDDCRLAPPDQECWRDDGGPDDAHNDIWLIDPDGSNLRRVTPGTASSWPGRRTASTW